jgi:hypothetical protein
MYKASILAAAAVVALSAMPAEAGNGRAVGAGLVGFGVGALVGSALAPREVYVVPPPPPPPVYYGQPVMYAPPAWSPGWYSYCGRYATFNPRTGYYVVGGRNYFCR